MNPRLISPLSMILLSNLKVRRTYEIDSSTCEILRFSISPNEINWVQTQKSLTKVSSPSPSLPPLFSTDNELVAAIIDHLISLYPEPGKAYKRSYRASEKKRQLKLAEKEAKKLARQEKARKKKEGKGGSASASLPEKRKIKSTELVESSDEEEEEEGGDESSSDDSEEE